jgi:hypothetical protein
VSSNPRVSSLSRVFHCKLALSIGNRGADNKPRGGDGKPVTSCELARCYFLALQEDLPLGLLGLAVASQYTLEQLHGCPLFSVGMANTTLEEEDPYGYLSAKTVRSIDIAFLAFVTQTCALLALLELQRR